MHKNSQLRIWMSIMRQLFNRVIQSKLMRNLVKVIKLQATIQCKFMCLKQLLDCRKLVKLWLLYTFR